MNDHSIPVEGPIGTRPFRVLAVLGTIGLLLLGWRFLFGLGSVTALNDGYPWGLWIVFDVVVGTALATGGYAIAILVYVLNKGQYHPLVRSAMVTSALGYTLGAIGVVIDLGRFWGVWKVPILFWNWNFNSILLEVALCITLYVLVLWVEVSPAFLDRWKQSEDPRVRRSAERAIPVLKRALPFLLALGLLLPTMHQSSLGSLMLLAGPRLHALWSTPLLPLLFLISCIAMGYAVVVLESTLASRAFNRPSETHLLAGLSTATVVVLSLYVGIRLLDVVVRGQIGLVLAGDVYSLLFLLEMTLFVVPLAMLLNRRRLTQTPYLFQAAMVIVAAGALYRFSTFLLAFNPGAHWSYFPAVAETLLTVGLVSLEIMAYIVIVKRFPILRGAPVAARPDTRREAWASVSS
jgi:Ni/Fe-hydrogenase subunit HybB-like protein